MELESLARELKMLATKDKLTPAELDRAKDLMAQLKGMGISNAEIVELTGGRWGESTTKGYTKGVKATDPRPWQSTTALFSEMLSANFSIADVSRAMSITTELEGMGSSLGDVVSFMDELKRKETNVAQLKAAIDVKIQLEQMGTSPGEIAGFVKELEEQGIDIPSFDSLFCEWHEANLTAADARSVLSYKAQLEQAGLDMTTVSQIAEATRQFGGSGEVLEALAKCGSLNELDQEMQKRRQRLDAQAADTESRSRELDTAGRKLEKLRAEIGTREKTLSTYERLKSIGFDEKTLARLARAAQKYGTSRQVLAAIDRFGGLANIKTAEAEWRNKIKRKQEMVKSLDAQYTHLKEPIELCKKLLERKFSLTAISLIDAAARKYGEPIEVMKAIEAHAALGEIAKKTTRAKTELAEVEGKVEALKQTCVQQNARNMAILDQFEALNAKAIRVGRTVGSIEEQLKTDPMAHDLLTLLQNPTSASYESSLPLILVLMKDITVWATIHKNRFQYPSLVSSNLEQLLGNLGAG